MKSRIMYIEFKGDDLEGPAHIGRVTFSKTMKTIYYGDQSVQSFRGFKANYYDLKTKKEYWISGPKTNGEDRLYVGGAPVEIDEDIREEYWIQIRNQPDNIMRAHT